MITLRYKEDCCGCQACAQICPRQCIIMQEDREGFLYPHIHAETCINCHLCEQVCPVLHQNRPALPLEAWAAKHPLPDIRMKSSSGGVFSQLAEQTLQQGGVVFGARFNEKWEVIHDYTETLEGLAPFRKSKYVQSRIGETYRQAETFLKQGRQVLFTGVPCQISGLKHYLRKEYDNLLSVDIICHGVPSPKIWREYLAKLSGGRPVTQVDFRNKSTGWESYSFTVKHAGGDHTEPYGQNPYMQGFLHDLYLRPSCYACPAKGNRNASDLTLGDYWGISNVHPQFKDSKGVSAVVVRTPKGKDAMGRLALEVLPSSVQSIQTYNPSLVKTAGRNPRRARFFRKYKGNLQTTIPAFLKVSLLRRIMRKAHLLMHKISSLLNK